MKQEEFADEIKSLGGDCYIVGGWVRDRLRGVEPHDTDYVVTVISKEEFESEFPTAKLVGNSFPVYLLNINGEDCEVAFARTERKTGNGYHGFSVNHKNVTIEEDLYRRDLTINAMAYNLTSKEVIDPYGGKVDIGNKIIRHVSEHFSEDPVRALRAARQASVFDYTIHKDTINTMNQCKEELRYEPWERAWKEMFKALGESKRPSMFFRWLKEADLLDTHFKEINNLIGKSQPWKYHPEGDAFEHSMIILDDVSSDSENPLVRFCALVHDIGKSITPEEMLPHHYGHDKAGIDVINQWNIERTLPRDHLKAAIVVIRNHMRVTKVKKPGKMLDILLSVHKSPISIKDFGLIVSSDSKELPYFLENGDKILNEVLKIRGDNHPKELHDREVGEWLRGVRIRKFRELLNGGCKDD